MLETIAEMVMNNYENDLLRWQSAKSLKTTCYRGDDGFMYFCFRDNSYIAIHPKKVKEIKKTQKQ